MKPPKIGGAAFPHRPPTRLHEHEGGYGARMTIDRSGQRRPETASSDLDAYLSEFRAGRNSIARVFHAACARCGGSEFGMK
ncbi:hypothetical protein ML5_5943 [Micromonospora sp. L5]|nr:hypothetical protein ML5_5943 [Micromonospora sp. L5]